MTSRNAVSALASTMGSPSVAPVAACNGVVEEVWGDMAYVVLDGSKTPTPARQSVAAAAGDRVQVRFDGRTAVVVGNMTAPPDKTVGGGAVRDDGNDVCIEYVAPTHSAAPPNPNAMKYRLGSDFFEIDKGSTAVARFTSDETLLRSASVVAGNLKVDALEVGNLLTLPGSMVLSAVNGTVAIALDAASEIRLTLGDAVSVSVGSQGVDIIGDLKVNGKMVLTKEIGEETNDV